MRHNPLNGMWPWFDLYMHPRVKGHKVNWKIIYDFLFVLHTNIGHSMHRFWDIGLTSKKLHDAI